MVDWTGLWWLYKIPITDEDEALPVPPEPPLDGILWMIDEGKKDELEESDKVLLRPLSSVIGLISGDRPLLLLEAQEYKDMKIKAQYEETKGYF